MNSGQLITYYIPVMLAIFVVWELIQLARRRAGNESARTMSQYVVKQAKAGKRHWQVFAIAFPVFLAFVGIWLLFHWEGLCHAFGWLCEIDI